VVEEVTDWRGESKVADAGGLRSCRRMGLLKALRGVNTMASGTGAPPKSDAIGKIS
jgi:hypothetical protein